MRVCFVSPTGGSGGGERSMLDLIDALSARGVDCRVVVPGPGYVSDALTARGVEYAVCYFRTWCSSDLVPLRDRLLKRPAAHLVRGARLAGTIRAWKSEVVLTNTLSTCEGAVGARLLGIPHVTHVREYGDLDHGWRFELGPRLSMRILSAMSQLVVFNSTALARHYRREVPLVRARVVYNAVTVPARTPMEPTVPIGARADSPFRCVLVGVVVASKGPEEAIRAVNEAVRRGLPVRLKIVGGGPQRYLDYLNDLIHSWGLGQHVEMVGHVVNPFPFLQEADVALMCSRMEAFGRVTVEAMKMGIPVIGVNSGGTPEVIRHGFNGLLYAPGEWRELADKIQSLCADREATKRMGHDAQEWATRTFNEARYGKDMLAVLHEATGRSALAEGSA